MVLIGFAFYLCIITLCSKNNLVAISSYAEVSTVELDFEISTNSFTENNFSEICSHDKPCLNGGTCESRDSATFCSCAEGAVGSFCEILVACKNKRCGSEAICWVNPTDITKSFCKCKKEGLEFDNRSKKCKEMCSKEKPCLNWGHCGLSRFCFCYKGTKGSFCEILVACENKNCGTEANCQVDIFDKTISFCKCKEDTLMFDERDKKCKRTCDEYTPCLNGGACKSRDSAKFCTCPGGTKGYFCEILVACKNKNCGADAECQMDSTDPSIVACKCKEKSMRFDEKDKKCKVSKCKNICGVDYEDDDGLVLCEVDPYGTEFSCRCKEKEKDFFPGTKSCKLNQCRRECGTDSVSEAEGSVVCTGDPYGKWGVSCSCRGENFEFLPDEKLCWQILQLSDLDVAAIALGVIVCPMVIVVTVLFCRRKSSGNSRRYVQNITLESPLYTTQSETLPFPDESKY